MNKEKYFEQPEWRRPCCVSLYANNTWRRKAQIFQLPEQDEKNRFGSEGILRCERASTNTLAECDGLDTFLIIFQLPSEGTKTILVGLFSLWHGSKERETRTYAPIGYIANIWFKLPFFFSPIRDHRLQLFCSHVDSGCRFIHGSQRQ